MTTEEIAALNQLQHVDFVQLVIISNLDTVQSFLDLSPQNGYID